MDPSVTNDQTNGQTNMPPAADDSGMATVPTTPADDMSAPMAEATDFSAPVDMTPGMLTDMPSAEPVTLSTDEPADAPAVDMPQPVDEPVPDPNAIETSAVSDQPEPPAEGSF